MALSLYLYFLRFSVGVKDPKWEELYFHIFLAKSD